ATNWLSSAGSAGLAMRQRTDIDASRNGRKLMGRRPRKQAVLIAGPTASGKSALALETALRTGAVIINADAMQVYDVLRVVTARPTPEEMQQVPHRLYGTVPPAARFSTGDWLRAVATILDDADT